MQLVKASQLFDEGEVPDEDLLWQLFWEEGRQESHRSQLVQLYTPFARKISLSLAIKFRSLGVAPDDCSQNGLVGLLEAIERFQPGSRATFKTYAAYRIRGSVLNGITHYNEQLDLLSHKRQAEKERVASVVENRDKSGDSLDRVIDATLDLAIAVLIDEIAEDDTFEQTSPYPTNDQYLLSRHLFDLAMELPEKESMVIFYHYFLDYRFREVADLMGLSPGRVSQIHSQALRRIRESYGAAQPLEFNA